MATHNPARIEYLACEIHPWEPRTSRTMRRIAVMGDGVVVDVSRFFAAHSDREAARMLGVLVWMDPDVARTTSRGVNPAYVAATEDEGARFMGVRKPERAVPHRDEPTYARPPRAESVAYAPTLSMRPIDLLHTQWARMGEHDKAAMVNVISRILTEDSAFTNVRMVAIELVLMALDDDDSRMGFSDAILGDLTMSVARCYGKEAFWADPQPFRRKKKDAPAKQVAYADKYRGVSAGTYTPRVHVARMPR